MCPEYGVTYVSGRTPAGLVVAFLRGDASAHAAAFVNIQHPASDVDRTIEITTEPNFQRGNRK
jgi:hypothetical protein